MIKKKKKDPDMSPLPKFWALFRRKKLDADMDAEMQSHLERRIDANLAAGMSPEEARYAAQRQFGGVDQIKEIARDERGILWLENFLRDFHYGLRNLAKTPGFTLVAVLTLALGIGANTAIFSVINAALLEPLQYSEASQLVEVWNVPNGSPRYPVTTGPQFKQFRDHATKFSDASGYHKIDFNLIEAGKAERVVGLEVTGGFLSVLRLNPLHGHRFDATAGRVGGENRVVMLTYDWWHSRFGGDPAIVGKVINFNQQSHVVAGVLPPHALVVDDAKFLVPLVLEDAPWRMDPNTPWLNTLFRLKPGVTPTEAQEEVRSLAAELNARISPDRSWTPLGVVPLQTTLTASSRPTLLMLLGAVVLVLLIACANVANLLLARATARQKEMAVRTALGATGSRIMRQVLTESVLLSLLGGVVGIGIAIIGVQQLGRAVVGVLPSVMQPTINLPVLVFSLVLACGTGVLFGVFPAMRARRIDLNRDLKESGRGSSSGSRTRAQSSLIVTEIALTAMLLIGAGLLLRSFARILISDPGFKAQNALVCDIAMTPASFPADENVIQYSREIIRRLEALPTIEAVGTTTTLPLSGEVWGSRIGLSEKPISEHNTGSTLDFVSGNYFRAMGISLLNGRILSEADNSKNVPRVAVINERLAAELMPGQNPIGRRIHLRDADWEVVGVVGNLRQIRVDEPAPRHVYLPHVFEPYTLRLVVRTRVAPMTVAEELRRTIAAINADQSVSNLRTLEQVFGRALQERRVALMLLGIFAVVALSLACLGIYGVMAYTIGQRERELCIRMALGAGASAVVHLVLRDGAKLCAIGIIAGLLGGIAGSRLIASRLYAVSALDPVVFTAVAALLCVVAALSVYLPARRAARANPIDVLRGD
jgi:predicted permease